MAFKVSFNGKAVPNFVKIKAVKYTALPELQNSFVTRTSGVGLIDNGTQILGKTIKMDFILIKDHRSILQLTQEFAGWLMGNNFNLSPLVITDGETVTYQAKVSNGVEISDAIAVGEGTVEFIVPTGVAEGGNAPITISGNTITVNYTGTAITYPVVKVDLTQSTSVVKISDPDNGREVIVYGSFRAGDVVEIDCRNKRVKVNGYINMKGVALESTWLSYPTTGTYKINCLGAGTWTCRVPIRYY